MKCPHSIPKKYAWFYCKKAPWHENWMSVKLLHAAIPIKIDTCPIKPMIISHIDSYCMRCIMFETPELSNSHHILRKNWSSLTFSCFCLIFPIISPICLPHVSPMKSMISLGKSSSSLPASAVGAWPSPPRRKRRRRSRPLRWRRMTAGHTAARLGKGHLLHCTGFLKWREDLFDIQKMLLPHFEGVPAPLL